jgi:tellurite resistance protein
MMDFQKREIYRAIAEVAYVIAKADRGLSPKERMAFNDIIREELDYDAWVAESRFEILDELVNPTMEEAYKQAMANFRRYKNVLTPELKEKAKRVVQQVAEACCGFSAKEGLILARFEKDLNEL